VALIEIRTPYEQIALRAHQISVGYSAQQAERDYRAHSDVVMIRVRIRLTPTYFQVRSLDFWRDFSVHCNQERELTPKKIVGSPLRGGRGPLGLIGADVELEFDGAQVTSDVVRVEVFTPDGQKVDAEFDLGKLR
jgi:hypothetical protein